MEVVALTVLAVAAALMALLGGFPGRSKSSPPWSNGNRSDLRRPQQPVDASDQLRTVMGAPFRRQRLMSRTEYTVFRTVETHLRQCGPGFRLMAQTSMGEFLSSPDRQAYLSVNSKRVDMLVIDTFGMPVLAIEHQGSGHFQGDAPARDAVKREAMRKAGIEFLEIFDYHQPADICRLVGDAIGRQRPPASPNAISPRQSTGS